MGRLTLPGFKAEYKAIVIKTIQDWYKKRQINHKQKREYSNRPTHIWTTDFLKVQWQFSGRRQSSQQTILEQWIPTYKLINLIYTL